MIKPSIPSVGGPSTPVERQTAGESGANTAVEEDHMPIPVLPGVALTTVE